MDHPRPAAPVISLAASAARGPQTDEQVLERVRAGDTALFELLMRRHNQQLYRAARAIVRDEAEAEDVVQQAYLSAFAHLDLFAGGARLSTWLTSIVVHEALGRRRRAARAPLALVEHADEVADVSDGGAGPEAALDRAELARLLERTIDALPEMYRTVLVLRDVQELDTAETAAALGVTAEAVRVRLFRARQLARTELLERAGAAAADVFAFDGARCDRIVLSVMSRLLATTA
jgi:RNA polymerase sigma-70 factor (ECF subfamily)